MEIQAKRIEITGIVQGVGFRPFVYQLANRHDLSGQVANTAAGVVIHVEGTEQGIRAFLSDLSENPPPLSRITDIATASVAPKRLNGFVIAHSRTAETKSTLISPDVAMCEDCSRELFDPNDRRYRYPFINCTNCGPRYTIIADVPYDRPQTSMKDFVLCPACRAEYEDPANRRFHAQPNACPVCGPWVSLCSEKGRPLDTADPIAAAARLLRKGRIVAIKGLGGFHLAVDAENEEAVCRLRKRKRREEKPFALMSREMAAVRRYARVSAEEEALMTAARRPVVLVPKRPDNRMAPSISPKNRFFGVMLPYTPLHHLLFDHGFVALVMTSANASEEPICIDNDEAFERLAGIADAFLIHNRDIYLRCDDSIVRYAAGNARMVRRSRGYVPVPVFLHHRMPQILACGAELKNTVCLTKENRAFLSQHIGDMENLETLDFFTAVVSHLKRILDISPRIVACDPHPDYLSTRYAESQQRMKCVHVQHHHAHIVSCMAEHHLAGPVIGLSFDGTGYGADGRIWGGEILLCTAAEYKRVGQLAYTPMPGGAAAIREPWRMAIAHLYAIYGDAVLDLDLPITRRKDAASLKTVVHMIASNTNTPLTSSMGRLFDAVAAIVGIRETVRFEGQAAMELEMAADAAVDAIYDHDWCVQDGIYIVSPSALVSQVVDDVRHGVPVSTISGRFHATLAALFADICHELAGQTGYHTVALSGGVFQNRLLLEKLTAAIESKGIAVFSNRIVPTNDGGISLGQAVAAAAIVKSD